MLGQAFPSPLVFEDNLQNLVFLKNNHPCIIEEIPIPVGSCRVGIEGISGFGGRRIEKGKLNALYH